ncbi:MAG: hypothetical protein AAGH15_04240 [Myxococcota bacterium]
MTDATHWAHAARWGRTYQKTRIPEGPSAWTRLGPERRRRLVKACWIVNQTLLVGGWFDPRLHLVLVGFCVAHALLFLGLVGFRPLVFPAQLRLSFLALIAAGVFVPGMQPTLMVPTLGGFALLLAGYCPLARILYLLPWNRTHALTPELALRVFLQKPAPGRFEVRPAELGTAAQPA